MCSKISFCEEKIGERDERDGQSAGKARTKRWQGAGKALARHTKRAIFCHGKHEIEYDFNRILNFKIL